jgi:hypothetical protein
MVNANGRIAEGETADVLESHFHRIRSCVLRWRSAGGHAGVGDPEAIFGTCAGADYEVDRDRVLRTDRLLLRVNGEMVVDATWRGAVDPSISQFFVDSRDLRG